MSGLKGKRPKKAKKPVTPAHSAARAYQDAMKGDAGNPYNSPYVRDIVNPPKSRNALAMGHPDLRQSNTNFSDVLANMRTARGNIVDLGVNEHTPGGFSHAGEVALRLFDAAGQAGQYSFDSNASHAQRTFPSANPLRPDYHQSRGSATPANGSHSLGNATSAPRQSMKGSEALSIMKDTQRVIT